MTEEKSESKRPTGVSEQQWRAHLILTRYFAGVNYTEIAALCGVSHTAVGKLFNHPDSSPRVAQKIVETFNFIGDLPND